MARVLTDSSRHRGERVSTRASATVRTVSRVNTMSDCASRTDQHNARPFTEPASQLPAFARHD
jgi:hypothetical protein